MEAIHREITHLSQTIETLKKDAPNAPYSRNPTSDVDDDYSPSRQNYNPPPSLYLYDSVPHKPHVGKRKEIEVRRYNGKELINEYLLQFELTAKRNAWTDAEKASSLLCALDGTARSILSELDDVDNVAFDEIKQLLKRRFGPVQQSDIHEQALGEIRLTRGQSIRELTPEVLRLTKLAYPEFTTDARTRLAVKALVNAIPDKEAVFYIKDKSPSSVDEVCSLYERYKALTGSSQSHKSTSVRVVKPAEADSDTVAAAISATTGDHLRPLMQQAEATSRQLQQLTEAVNKLVQQTAARPVLNPVVPPTPMQGAPPPFMLSANAPVFHPESKGNQIPRKPCPKCKEYGHWARQCPAPPATNDTEYHQQLNTNRPASAPHVGPVPHPRQ